MAVSFSSWRQSAEAPLHVLFVVHFLFTSWSHLGVWSANRLLFQDAFFLLGIMWATHDKRSPSPVLLSLAINVLSILLDVIALSVSFPSGSSSTEEFSAVMAIFNLVIRLFSSFVLFKLLGGRDDLDPSTGPAFLPPGLTVTGGDRADAAQQQQQVSRQQQPASRPGSRLSNNNAAEGGGGGPPVFTVSDAAGRPHQAIHETKKDDVPAVSPSSPAVY